MPKKKKVDEKLLAFSSKTLTDAQDKFIRKFIKSGDGVLRRRDTKRRELETVYESVTGKLVTVQEGIEGLGSLIRNPSHVDAVGELQTKRGFIVGGIGIKAKDTSDALAKLQTADTKLDELITEIGKVRDSLSSVDGTEKNDREAIGKLRVAAGAELKQYLASWDVGYAHLKSEMNSISPGTTPQIPPEADLQPTFRELNGKLSSTPKDIANGVEEAKKEFGALTQAMKEAYDKARKALDTYAGGAFKEYAKIIKLYDVLDGTMSEYSSVASSLGSWNVDSFGPLDSRAKELTTEIEDFGDGKVPMEKLKETFESLNSKSKVLLQDARKAMSAAQLAFGSEQKVLQDQYNKLKSALDGIDKKVLPNEQREPIAAFLAATEASINKLGGANVAALKAARQMLVEAERQVGIAKNITSTNNEIKSNIDVAKQMLAPLLKDKAPVHEAAGEHEKVRAAFEGEWVKQAPDEAVKRSGEIKKTAEDLKAQNAMLTSNRAAADVEIRKLEEKYKAFNDLFKDLLKAKNADKVRDYRGPVRSEIDGVKTWNTTKMDPSFHSTIMSRVSTLSKEMDERMNLMRASLNSSNEELKERVDSAKEELEKAKGDGSSKEDVDKLQQVYDQAFDAQLVYADLSKDLLAQEEQERRYVDARKQFLADADTFIKDEKKKMSSAKDLEPYARYKDEIERQIVRLEATVKAAKADEKGPTGTRGLAELKEVKGIVERIAARGNQIPPDKLNSIGTSFSDGALDFLDKSGQIVDEVAKFEKAMGMDDKGSRAIEGVLSNVYGRIASNRLNEAGKILGPNTPPKSAQERKAAREIALSEVRRIKKAVMDDPVVNNCLANPFGKGGLTTTAIARLEQIELDVLRGA